MKNIVVFVFLLFLGFSLQSQTCDIFITKFNPSAKEVFVGDQVDISFGIKNNAKGVDCQYAAGSVKAYLFFPSNGIRFSKLVYPSGGKGEYFDWVFDPASNALVGTNYRPIGDGQGEGEVTVLVEGLNTIELEMKRSIGLSLVQNEVGTIFPANDHSNDNKIIEVTVRNSSSNQGLSLSISNPECGLFDSWVKGVLDRKEGQLELWRSEDGYSFEMIQAHKLEEVGKQISWNVKDNKALQKNHLYTYKLIHVFPDGSANLMAIKEILHNCMWQSEFQIYPNPALDKATVFMGENSQLEKVDLDFRNSTGVLVKTYNNINKQNNLLDLSTLPSGIYFISVRDHEEFQSKKFVKLAH